MPEITRNFRIHGRVQGVSYRDWTVKTATKLGLHGWVRNREDGTVEAVVQGDEAAVGELLAQCHKGPFLAKVSRIDVSETEREALGGTFTRKPTA